jgi:hypothetical protein
MIGGCATFHASSVPSRTAPTAEHVNGPGGSFQLGAVRRARDTKSAWQPSAGPSALTPASEHGCVGGSRQAILDHPLHGSFLEGELLTGLRQVACWRPTKPRQGGPVTPDQARRFVAANHWAVMITRRSTGGLQTSPVLVGIDSAGKVSSAAGRPPTRSATSAAAPPPPCASSMTTSSAPGSRSTAPQKSCPSPTPWTG